MKTCTHCRRPARRLRRALCNRCYLTPEVRRLYPLQEPVRAEKPPCRHCGTARGVRPRRLCWACYYMPGVREQYPSVSKFGNRGLADRYGLADLGEPTAHLPGSKEKVRVMIERAALRLALFHPMDATKE